jgi:hypothetical protein
LSDDWREAFSLIGEPGFWPWRSQVVRTGGCANPIHLTGECRFISISSGEVLHAYSTINEPGERTLVACGDRRASRCRPCSETYRADTYQLIKAGVSGGKGVPETVKQHPQVFATLTAPSFGAVHHRVIGPDGKVRRCHPRLRPRCCRRHRDDDPLLGTPLDPESYDYPGAVVWNALAPKLWARTMDLLTKELARLAGYSQRAFAQVGRRSFGKVAEVQARGLTHYHAIIRLDGISRDNPGAVVAPGAWASVDLLERAIGAAVSRVVLVGPDGSEMRWGRELDVRPIASGNGGEQLSDSAVAGYIAKYATKGAECTGTVDRPLFCRTCGATGRVTAGHATVECADCAGTGSVANLESLPVGEQARRMIQACWQLGGRPELMGLRLRQWAHALGYGGHFSTKTRRYSTTLTALRTARRDHHRAQILHLLGLDASTAVIRDDSTDEEGPSEGKPSDDGVVVVGHWRYAGRGHRAGEARWASAVAEDIAQNRKIARWALGEQAAAEAELWRGSKPGPPIRRDQHDACADW